VKELEEDGIGRPSTYASILSVIQDKKYVEKIEGRFHPTELGKITTEELVKHFPSEMDVTFTAGMEEQLDQISEGEIDWRRVLRDFYGPSRPRWRRPSWRCVTSSGRRSPPTSTARSAGR
jgi:DNA topoisomerase-1